MGAKEKEAGLPSPMPRSTEERLAILPGPAALCRRTGLRRIESEEAMMKARLLVAVALALTLGLSACHPHHHGPFGPGPGPVAGPVVGPVVGHALAPLGGPGPGPFR